jgi:hypothetical protein
VLRLRNFRKTTTRDPARISQQREGGGTAVEFKALVQPHPSFRSEQADLNDPDLFAAKLDGSY